MAGGSRAYAVGGSRLCEARRRSAGLAKPRPAVAWRASQSLDPPYAIIFHHDLTQGANVQNSLAIENIDELRLEQGIDDVELHNEIRALQVGGFVKLTLLTGVRGSVSETLLFRITDRKGSRFRGELAAAPTVSGLSGVAIGLIIHILGSAYPFRSSLPAGPRTREDSQKRVIVPYLCEVLG